MARYGRPKLPDAERREALKVNVRFNEAERQIVEAKAAAAGVTATEWTRLAALERDPPERRVVPEVNRAAWLELARVAATLNGAIWRLKPQYEHGLMQLLEIVRRELGAVRNGLIGNTEEGGK